MFNSILNFEGVTVLNKKQQSNINGGAVQEGQECILTFTFAHNGQTVSESGYHYSAGAAGSAEANADCVAGITSGAVTSCSYDCEYDGFGQ